MKHLFKYIAKLVRRRPLIYVLNVLGLSLGLAVCILLMIYIQSERSFDKGNAGHKNIYRILNDVSLDGKSETWCITPNAMSAELMKTLPAVQYSTRVLKHGFGQPAYITAGGNYFKESNMYYCDDEFVKIFTVPFVDGDPAIALLRPNTAIISESMSKKLFRGESVGKTFVVDFRDTLEVTGVYRDLPGNSSFDCNIIASYKGSIFDRNSGWRSASVETYCLTNTCTRIPLLEKEISDVSFRHTAKEARIKFERNSLQPLDEIHLYSGQYKNSFITRTGSIREIGIMSILAMIILIIACLNYMNLATAQFHRQIANVGLKKMLGASSRRLIWGSYAESCFLVSIAFAIGFGLAIFLKPLFEMTIGKELTLGGVLNGVFFSSIFLVWVFTILVAGSYPAFSLTRFTPVQIMRQTFHRSGVAVFIRRWLSVTQFAVSIILICFALVIYDQIRYVNSKDLGYRPENVIALDIPTSLPPGQAEAALHEFAKDPEVMSGALAQGFPGTQVSIRKLYKDPGDTIGVTIATNNADGDILDVLNVRLLAGRTLPKLKSQEDTTIQVVLNKTAVDYLGLTPQQAVGRKVHMQLGNNAYIVGVVADFNFQSLESPIGGYAFHNDFGDPHPYILLRTSGQDAGQLLSKLALQFKQSFLFVPFEYDFLDQFTASLYEAHVRNEKIILIFSFLAIFISALGLFGLTIFTFGEKEKQIGIRKVLGSGLPSIAFLLLRDFVLLILIAMLIGLPVSWYICHSWLNNFAYRIPFSFLTYLLAVLITLGIGLVTISYQTFRAIVKSPIGSMRYQ